MSGVDDKTFYLKDCSLTTIALGLRAQTLIELRDKVAVVPQGCLYTHFWGGRLSTRFEHTEFHNDFSIWAHQALHDDVLAERLDIINPIDYDDMEGLRSELLDEIETRLEEKDTVPLSRRDQQFHFARSKIIVFDTEFTMSDPNDFLKIAPHLTPSSLFYHIIDASRRVSSKASDFSVWLEGFSPKYDDLIQEINKIDPYFISLKDLKVHLIESIEKWQNH